MTSAETKGYLNQDIEYTHCTCAICQGDLKPSLCSQVTQGTLSQEKTLNDTDAYEQVAKKIAMENFPGRVAFPETFIVNNSLLISFSRVTKRIRTRLGQSNIEVKKHFEERRKKSAKDIAKSLSMTGSTQGFSKPKEVAVLTYLDGTLQILSDTLLKKILEKRKSDPFWQQVSRIALIPLQVKDPLQLHTYTFSWCQQEQKQIHELMVKMAKRIDEKDQQIDLGQQEDGLGALEESIEEQSFTKRANRTSHIRFRSSKEWNISDYSSETASVFASILDQEKLKEQLRKASMQIVVYFQVVYRIRILNLKLQFLADDRQLYLFKVSNYVAHGLKQSEIGQIHDRYKPLQGDSAPQLVDLKLAYDSKQVEEVWSICAGITSDCLQARRIELKLPGDHKPTSEQLRRIFVRLFPDFSPKKILSGVNWKNELPVIMSRKRAEIWQAIRNDQGIRILKRFGVYYNRTFS